MTPHKTSSRLGYIYTILAILLVVISVSLLLKPVMRIVYPLYYEEEIEKYSRMYNIDQYVIMGIISAESKFDKDALSHKDARGLMQVTDETANWCIEVFDIDTSKPDYELNINIGCAYLRYLIDKYNANIHTAIAAYNAGEGNVSQWLTEQGADDYHLRYIPFPETEKYVETVEKREKIYRFLYS